MAKHYKIYTLESSHTDRVYVGKTTSSKQKEMCYLHKVYYSYLKGKTTQYYSFFDMFKFRDCVFDKVDGITTNDINKADGLLKYWRSKLNCCSNDKTKKHWIKYKDTINKQRKIKHKCFCGGKYTNASKNTHFKSNHHTLYETDPIYKIDCDIKTVINMSNEINKDHDDQYTLSLLIPAQLKQSQPPTLRKT
jgi:hypothetical protein